MNEINPQAVQILRQLLCHPGPVQVNDWDLIDELLEEFDIIVGALDQPGAVELAEQDEEGGYYVPFRNVELEAGLYRRGIKIHGNGQAGFYVYRPAA